MNAATQALLDAACESFARGQYSDAHAQVARVLRECPDSVGAIDLAGKLLLKAQKPENALPLFEQVLREAPDLADVWMDRAQALMDLGRAEDAVASVEQALAAAPQAALVHARLGDVRLSLNQRERAAEAFRAALSVDPRLAVAWWGLSRAERLAPGGAEVAAIEALIADPSLQGRDRAELHYALSATFKGRDDARFIENVLAANAAERRDRVEPADRYEDLFARIRGEFDGSAPLPGAPDPSPQPTPIFVLGMWRSGTTLVEQIVSSHPDVMATGELNYIRGPMTWEIETATKRRYPSGFHVLPEAARARLAAGYRRRIASLADGARCVTDKTPGNFHAVGLILTLFPDARIIHTRRDPMDTCFSMLQYPFIGSPLNTCDVETMARYYALYEQLMAHWDAVFPGRLFTVQYEELVADPEPVGRAMAAHVGLDWRPEMLSFHERSNLVKTFSATQVRQPVHGGSVGAWRRHTKELEPLRQALEDALGRSM